MSTHASLEGFLEQACQAYEGLKDAVTVLDRDNRLVYVNSACEMLYDYTREELVGESLSLIASHRRTDSTR